MRPRMFREVAKREQATLKRLHLVKISLDPTRISLHRFRIVLKRPRARRKVR
jgi:hypothetical protein